jgi:type II secretory pathway pseudopilin PulG
MNSMKQNKQKPRGFALVATLSLMILLAILAVGMLSLSTVSLRTSGQANAQAEARANARMALMIAIGELQKQMGPDQRISANGAMLDTLSADGSVQEPAKHPHWTGVWDSWIAGPKDTAPVNGDYPSAESHHQTLGSQPDDSMRPEYGRKDKHFRAWLVSLLPEDAEKAASAKDLVLDGKELPDMDDAAIRLVGAGSTSSTDYVSARLLETPSPKGGRNRYAWWVGDESQKARVLHDSYVSKPPANSAEKIFRGQSPASTGTKAIADLEEITAEQDARLQGLPTLKTLDLVANDPAKRPAKRNFHSVSPYSQSVLSDVREGGLKRDLSVILEQPIVLANQGPEYMLYEFDDPRFTDRAHSRVPIQDLAAYYQLYDHQATFGNGRREGVHFTSSGLTDAIQLNVPDYDGGIKDKQRALREYTTLYRQPVMTKIQYLLVVSSAPITDTDRKVVDDLIARNDFRNYVPNEPIRATDTHKLRVGIMPMVTLWNPTNLPLVMDKEQILEFSKPTPVIFKWAKHPGGGAPVESEWFNLSQLTKPHGNQSAIGNGFCFFRLSLGGAGANSVTFAPGEVKIFSADPSNGAMLDADGRTATFTTEGGVNRTINNFDPFAFFRMPNSAPAIRTSAPHFYNAYLPGGEGSHMVFNRNDSISLLVSNDTAKKSNWADSRTVANAFAIPGAAFAFSVLDPGYRARWQDGIDHIRHYSMISRHGTNAANTQSLWEFSNQLMTPAFPGGVSPIPFDGPSDAISGADLISAGNADEAIGLLEFSISLGCEIGTGAAGGFGGGRRLASRPFLHSPSGAPPFIDQSDPASLYNAGWDWQLGKVNNIEDSIVRGKPDSGNGYYGGGYTVESGTTHVIQREIPVLPPVSIASLSHAQLGGFSLGNFFMIGDNPMSDMLWHKMPRFNNPEGTDYQKTTATGQGGLGPHVMQAIGNSYAHPNIPAEKSFTTKARLFDMDVGEVKNVPFVDHSYLANKALWDEYFFSSIAPQPAKVRLYDASNDKTAKQVAEDFFFKDKPLPNRRITPYQNQLNQEVLDSRFTEAGKYTDGLADKIAANLMVEGGFNINSTSVEAWKTLLASLKGKPIAFLDGGSKPEEATTKETPLATGILPNAKPIMTSDIASPATPPEQWKTGRILTDKEIDLLAKAIVKQVKLRGPFLSLSEFINRRLDADSQKLPLSLKGALQAALDDDTVPINANFRKGNRLLDSQTDGIIGFVFPEAAKGPIAYGSMAYVDQADVLRNFSEQLTPRGDTFVIRSYGDALDPNGNIMARAWCEAVVQRVPEYVNPEDAPQLKQADPSLSAASKAFGRKIQIIGFRWLNSDEI